MLKSIEKVSAKSKLKLILKEILLKDKKYQKPEQINFIVSVLMEYAQEIKYFRDETDIELFLNFFTEVMKCEKMYKFKKRSLKNFMMSMCFSLSKSLEISEEKLSEQMKLWLADYKGKSPLLEHVPKEGKPNLYKMNVNLLKYKYWCGVELEDSAALHDLLRLYICMIPIDGGKNFGFSDLGIELSGDGIFSKHVVYLNFGKISEGVNVEMLEKSISTLTKIIREGIHLILDNEGDIGLEEAFVKYYEKCNDPLYITIKIGKKLKSIYNIHRMNNK